MDNEDDIDGEIDKLDAVIPFKELAALDDAKRNADRARAEQEDENEDEQEDTPKPKPAAVATDKGNGKDGEMPAWFKTYSDQQNKVIESLTNKLSAFEKQGATQTRRQQLEAKLKDAPEKFKARTLREFDRMKDVIVSDDDFTSYLADIEQDVADEIQAQSDAGLGGDEPTRGFSTGGSGKVKEASKEELDAVSQALNI
ncbi:hypothetical protein QT327_10490 [Olivibacter sp. 47]|uniref:hypothetical protein n=1 Tax=Olivibacter sp. 47 TaxID=3056486 RepID=UPI0025A4605C|nr:hypothetical protein [Olivibacter sp. 47]MDM8174779.1 hypothetical protein [Olivibacter sp. 47]